MKDRVKELGRRKRKKLKEVEEIIKGKEGGENLKNNTKKKNKDKKRNLKKKTDLKETERNEESK